VKKKSFLMLNKYKETFDKLGDAQAAALIRAIFAYANDGEMPNFNGDLAVSIIFDLIKCDMDYSMARWTKTCEARSNAGKRGGAPSGNLNARKTAELKDEEADSTEENKQNKQMVDLETENKQKQAKTSKNKQKQTKQADNDDDDDDDDDKDVKDTHVISQQSEMPIAFSQQEQNGDLVLIDQNEKEPKAEVVPKADLKADIIVQKWNDFCNVCGLSKVLGLNNKRRKKLMERLKRRSGAVDFYDDFDKILEAIPEQDFLMGHTKRGWRINFDFLIRDDNNYVRVLERQFLGGKQSIGEALRQDAMAQTLEYYQEIKQKRQKSEEEGNYAKSG
jgi:hypothetical protein